MKLGITSLGELQAMKEKMDLMWNDLVNRNSQQDEGGMLWVEKLPKCEGTGRRSSRSRSNRNIRSF